MTKAQTELEQGREKILLATLAHVPFDGWTDKAIAAGIGDAGVRDAVARVAFPGGAEDLAKYYADYADQRMIAAIDPALLPKMRIRERIIHVVRLRLHQAVAEREAVRGLMGWLAIPGHQGAAATCLYRSVDAMWRLVGDSSTDFNFYSKRAILAGVIAATVLHWLDDESDGFADTDAFLDRRIEDVMRIEKAKGQARKFMADLPDPFRILRDVCNRDKNRPPDGPPSEES